MAGVAAHKKETRAKACVLKPIDIVSARSQTQWLPEWVTAPGKSAQIGLPMLFPLSPKRGGLPSYTDEKSLVSVARHRGPRISLRNALPNRRLSSAASAQLSPMEIRGEGVERAGSRIR
jgi:hypothetical protein